MKHNLKTGFILPLTLGIIGLAIALVTYMVNNGRAFSPSAKTMIEREKARMLARSGIEIAMSQLSLPDKKEAQKTAAKPGEAKKEQEPASTEEKQTETLFSFIVPRINTWQKFSLTRAIEGMQGEIGVCVMCEEGKLDLNVLYDSATGKIGNESLDPLIMLLFEHIQKTIGGTDLRKTLEKFLQDRKTQLDDVTELLPYKSSSILKEFTIFKDHIFYEPPVPNAPKKPSLYLTDIFTIWSGKKTLQPWLLSASLRVLLELTRTQDINIEEKKKIVAEISKTLPDTLTWPDGWNQQLKLWYGNDFASLPKGIETLLDTKFEPSIFSVLCYGKVGKTTQKVFAIMERIKTSAEKDKSLLTVKLKKLYWL